MKRSGPATKFKRTNFPKYARAANAIGSAWLKYKGRSQTKSKSASPRSGLQGITTYQKDVKQVYRYKRAPRGLRKKWQRSRRSFLNNTLKAVASRKYHYSGNMTWLSNVGQQGFYGWFNYGVNGTGGVDGSGDLADVFTRLDAESRASGTSADAANGGANSRRYYCDHMRARCILTNTGTTPIFWEVYECTARKDIPVTPEGGTLQQFFNNMEGAALQASLSSTTGGALNTTLQTSASSRPQRFAVGVTPFQFRHFCQNWKISKVTRLQAAPGNTVSFDASNPRNLTVNWDNYLDLMCKKGVTKLYLVRQWGTVETISAVPQNSASSAVCEVEKDYNVKLLDTHLPELNYIRYTNITET